MAVLGRSFIALKAANCIFVPIRTRQLEFVGAVLDKSWRRWRASSAAHIFHSRLVTQNDVAADRHSCRPARRSVGPPAYRSIGINWLLMIAQFPIGRSVVEPRRDIESFARTAGALPTRLYDFTAALAAKRRRHWFDGEWI